MNSELQPPQSATHVPLSNREREVLQLLNTGAPVKSTAHRLGISVHTANQHVRQIYLKLAVRNRVMALNRARQLGLLDG